MVLCVEWMKLVGFKLPSPSFASSRRNFSVSSTQPRAVPVTMACGCSMPERFKVTSEVSSARRRTPLKRRATNGGMRGSSVSGMSANFTTVLIYTGRNGGVCNGVLLVDGAENTSDVSFPPKPNELQSTWRSCCWCSVCATGTMPSAIACCQLRLQGIKPWRMANRQITASMLPDALVVWPVRDLVDDTGGTFSPKTLCKAALSLASLLGVPVP